MHLGGLDGVVLVVHRRGRARHVVDLVHLCPEWLRDVVTDELKVGPVEQVLRNTCDVWQTTFRKGKSIQGEGGGGAEKRNINVYLGTTCFGMFESVRNRQDNYNLGHYARPRKNTATRFWT